MNKFLAWTKMSGNKFDSAILDLGDDEGVTHSFGKNVPDSALDQVKQNLFLQKAEWVGIFSEDCHFSTYLMSLILRYRTMISSEMTLTSF